MFDAGDEDRVIVTDRVEDPVVTAACAVHAVVWRAQRFANAVRVLWQHAGDELDDRRRVARRDTRETSLRGGRHFDTVGLHAN